MALTDNVTEELLRIGRERPHAVRSTLRVGDEVSRNFHRGSFVYRMDDLEVYKALGAFADDTSFYLAIENQFRVMVTDDYLRVFPPHERGVQALLRPFPEPCMQELVIALKSQSWYSLRNRMLPFHFSFMDFLAMTKHRVLLHTPTTSSSQMTGLDWLMPRTP